MKALLVFLAVAPTGTLLLGLLLLARRAWQRGAHGRALARKLAALEAAPDKGTDYGPADSRTEPDKCPHCGAGLAVAPVLDAHSVVTIGPDGIRDASACDLLYRCTGHRMPPGDAPPVPLDGDTVEAVVQAVRAVEPQMPSGGWVPRWFAGELAGDVAEWVLARPAGDRGRVLGLLIAHARLTGAMSVERAQWAVDGFARGPCGFAGKRSEWRVVWA